jgi:hydroxyethylthiazole kinase-like uncharacterized protein yjeF
MKVVKSKEMARIEGLAYHDGAKEEDFMESAGRGVAFHVDAFVEKQQCKRIVTLLCAKGNNSGDAYVAAVYLLRLGYSVFSYQFTPVEECSPLCRQNYYRYIGQGGTAVSVHSPIDCKFPKVGVIIDALFGTGFHGEAEKLFASGIIAANGSGLPIISIDIPSGLNGQTGEVASVAIEAQETVFLGLAKTGFFLRNGWNHVGRLVHVDFGLEERYILQGKEDFLLLTKDLVSPLLPKVPRIRHKYQAGYVVGLAGSPTMPGAALLASTAALRAGCGMMRLLHLEEMQGLLANSPYELIKEGYKKGDVDTVYKAMSKATAGFIGPGLTKEAWAKELLEGLLPKLDIPLIIDADALNLIAEHKLPIPKNSVLTPHSGEMQRLLGNTERVVLSLEWLEECQEYSVANNCVIVLKGHLSFILAPNESILVSSRGNPGMATAGSGDVLTGIIAALLAQGLEARDAATLGVYLHGVAGELAAEDLTAYSLIASDLISYLGKAYQSIS